jgi:hypothetical protein
MTFLTVWKLQFSLFRFQLLWGEWKLFLSEQDTPDHVNKFILQYYVSLSPSATLVLVLTSYSCLYYTYFSLLAIFMCTRCVYRATLIAGGSLLNL